MAWSDEGDPESTGSGLARLSQRLPPDGPWGRGPRDRHGKECPMICAAGTLSSQGPRTASEIHKQLTDLDEVRRVAEEYGSRDFASQVGLESITHHQESLREELRAAEMLESGSAVELVLDG